MNGPAPQKKLSAAPLKNAGLIRYHSILLKTSWAAYLGPFNTVGNSFRRHFSNIEVNIIPPLLKSRRRSVMNKTPFILLNITGMCGFTSWFLTSAFSSYFSNRTALTSRMTKKTFYAVTVGRCTGVYNNWLALFILLFL